VNLAGIRAHIIEHPSGCITVAAVGVQNDAHIICIGVAFAVQLIVEVTGRDFIAVPNLLVDVAIKADGSQDSHLLQRPQQQLLR